MNWNDRRNFTLGGTFDQLPGLRIEVTILLEVFPQFFGIESIGLFVDVHERDVSSRLGDGLGCGDEGMRDGDHDIAAFDAGSHEGEAQCVCAAIYPDAKLCITEPRKVALELLHHWSTDEAGIAECLLYNRQQLLFQLFVWRH